MEAARAAGAGRVVVASSDKAYGPPEVLPYKEGAALQPVYPEVSKAAADMIARSYWHTYQLPVAVTRFANIYGGGDLNFSRLVPETVSAVMEGRRPVIRSDGSPERDFLYVEDVARAYVAAEALAEGRGAGGAFSRLGAPQCGAGGGRADLRALRNRDRAGHSRREQPEGRNRPPVPGFRQDPRGRRWRPQVELREGLGHVDWYPGTDPRPGARLTRGQNRPAACCRLGAVGARPAGFDLRPPPPEGGALSS